ncbi:hypothetical protein INT45_006677 [Circinella minor]|uniref:Uncharacterized protein n=1 Tax=Circinella minor TaxID=1195481 RepID=A0A8H7RWF5_9FUNG|nr:hypothetical protein INT45_006677 [Circinella minor]
MNKRHTEEELQLVEDNNLVRLKNCTNSRCSALEPTIIQAGYSNGWHQLLFDYLQSANIIALESPDVTISSVENDTNVTFEDEYDEEEQANSQDKRPQSLFLRISHKSCLLAVLLYSYTFAYSDSESEIGL